MQHALTDSVSINIIRANAAAATFRCTFSATVSLQTKKIKGLHENDFIMATKIDLNRPGFAGGCFV